MPLTQALRRVHRDSDERPAGRLYSRGGRTINSLLNQRYRRCAVPLEATPATGHRDKRMDSSAFLIDHPSLASTVAESHAAAGDETPDTLPMLPPDAVPASKAVPLAVSLKDVAALAPAGGFSEFMDSISASEDRRHDALSLLIRSHRSALTDLSRLQRELRLARAEAAQQAAGLAEAIDLAGLLDWSLTLADRRLRVSPALARLFGWELGQEPDREADGAAAHGMSDLIDRVVADDREAFRAMLMQVLRRGVAERGEVRVLDGGGRPWLLRLRLKPLPDGAGRCAGVRALMMPAGEAADRAAPDDARGRAGTVPGEAAHGESVRGDAGRGGALLPIGLAAADHPDGLTMQDVVQAFKHESFHPVFQPVVDGLSGRTIGAEALIRWNHPQRGQVAPGEFLPLCEEAGLDGQLSRLMLRQACRHVADWQLVAGGQVFVSVNLSARQLARSELIWDIIDALAECGLPSSALMLEVSEATLALDPEVHAELMQYLKQTGVRIAIDSFGGEAESLRRLAALPVDCIKLDQLLTRDSAGATAAVIRGIVAYAASRGIDLVAKSVETAAQREALLTLGCRQMQGHLFARPEPMSAGGAPDR